MITLQIPEASPSLNDWSKAHWTVYTKLRRHWSMLVMVAKNQAKVRTHAPEHACVTVTRYGTRPLDTDNAVGGCKALIDSLKDHGLIVDDSPEHLTLTVTQMRVVKGDFPCTRIQISDRGLP